MNKIFITGNLTADPQTTVTNGGKSVCNFSVAVNEKFQGQETTTFYRCNAWNKTGELCQTYLKKGAKVNIEGRPQAPRPYLDRNGKPACNFEIMVNDVEFLSPAKSAEAPAAPVGFTPVENDDVPF